MTTSLPQVVCCILAGGQGSRLQPLTAHRCKPGVIFGGRYRLIDIPLSHAVDAGVQETWILSQYFSSDLQAHIQGTYLTNPLGCTSILFLTPEEREEGMVWYRGTADAMRQQLDRLLAVDADYILILSGDQLYQMNLGDMVSMAECTGADFLLASTPVPRKEAGRFGLLQVQGDRILNFHEKPQDLDIISRCYFSKDQDCLASMGTYLFRKEALIRLLEKEEGDDFGQHLIPRQISMGKSYHFIHRGYWEDIGTMTSFYHANLDLIGIQPQFDLFSVDLPIHSMASKLPGAKVINSTLDCAMICEGTHITKSSIQNSLIGTHMDIQEGCDIVDSIILGNHMSPKGPKRKLGRGVT
ncbi:MAG: sugar phosphate nucleotidyltransferase [Chlamydiota bacterium]|nr:sugar phosphate nucleotidyltransferase [Chlamydiota bacterium]